MKRTYKEVFIRPVAAGHAIHLDEAPLMSPAGRPLVAPTRVLADAVAEEWRAQRAEIDRQRLSLTSMLATWHDRVAPLAVEVTDQIMRYAETDLACYRAEAPPELVLRQEAALRPMLVWLAERFDVALEVVTGVMPRAQKPEALARLRAVVEAYDGVALTALAVATPAAGSLVIALAVIEGRLAPDEGFALSQIDETFQIEKWGIDEESQEARAAVAADIALAARFLALAAA